MRSKYNQTKAAALSAVQNGFPSCTDTCMLTTTYITQSYVDGLLHMMPTLNKFTDSGGAAALHSACLLGHTQVMRIIKYLTKMMISEVRRTGRVERRGVLLLMLINVEVGLV